MAAGSEAETVVRDSKDEQRDSDQYLVSGSTLRGHSPIDCAGLSFTTFEMP